MNKTHRGAWLALVAALGQASHAQISQQFRAVELPPATEILDISATGRFLVRGQYGTYLFHPLSGVEPISPTLEPLGISASGLVFGPRPNELGGSYNLTTGTFTPYVNIVGASITRPLKGTSSGRAIGAMTSGTYSDLVIWNSPQSASWATCPSGNVRALTDINELGYVIGLGPNINGSWGDCVVFNPGEGAGRFHRPLDQTVVPSTITEDGLILSKSIVGAFAGATLISEIHSSLVTKVDSAPNWDSTFDSMSASRVLAGTARRPGQTSSYARLWSEQDGHVAVQSRTLGLPSGVTLTSAYINHSGDVLALSQSTISGSRRSFYLQAVPEPSAMVGVVGGLAVLIARKTRRDAQQ